MEGSLVERGGEPGRDGRRWGMGGMEGWWRSRTKRTLTGRKRDVRYKQTRGTCARVTSGIVRAGASRIARAYQTALTATITLKNPSTIEIKPSSNSTCQNSGAGPYTH
jgi:hypothetical protein